ncbi:hypothetical protein PhCBS80983_g03579 [Powellomyces hirtus]|uniref:SGTA homodimerisation domain-containing protein n=1 Tax=Powellomyces hirtus TaxID=109895 RepID=A0A507E135_9FUNG|nr:hypothetical protein PhCBS80983_g03579 [Powellomyces hirtus]
MAAADKPKRLAFAICDYLQESIANGTIKQDDAEGIEVAIQCIGEAFGVDTSDAAQQTQYSIKPANLPKIFDIFLATQQKAAAAKTVPEKAASATSTSPAVSAETKAKAEELKTTGNKEMAAKRYAQAIELYTQAIGLNPENPVYYSNRAAAYTQIGQYDNAVTDAKKAVEIDSSYSKGYSRMGQAYFCLSKYQEAIDACDEGLRLEPGNASLKQTKTAAEQKMEDNRAPSRDAPTATPRSGGGMPDFASMMSNPNFMQMASSMMSNPAISSMMQNPAFTQMAQSMMSNPDAMSNLMNNPEMARMAENMLGGDGAAPPKP